jgi:hypothetical protein
MVWMAAVRDHPDRPPMLQSHVLTMLALRLDWSTGRGFASTAQLAADADCSPPTVKRATGWGRTAGMLVQARRGHRRGDGTTVASEWQLELPVTGMPVDNSSQRLTGDTLNAISRDQPPSLNGSAAPSQRLTGDPPSRPVTSRPSPSARGTAADIIRSAFPGATDDEIQAITEDRTAKGARSAEAVIRHELAEGILRLPCNPDGPGSHTSACRSGGGAGCGYDWCECRCHIPAAVTS